MKYSQILSFQKAEQDYGERLDQRLFEFKQKKNMIFDSYSLSVSMTQTFQRIKTASPLTRHRHQLNLMKEIKSLYLLDSQKTSHFNSCHQSSTSQLQLTKKTKTRHVKSQFYQKIQQIQKIRGKKVSSQFSLEKDQKKICESGWSDVNEKFDKQMEKSLKRARERARNLKKRNTVSNICIKNSVKPHEHQQTTIGNEKLKDIWQLAIGGEPSHEKYFRLTDISKAVKNSLVLKNAYQSCLHSKHYSQSIQKDFQDQKLKSYVYLNENNHKLPQKKKNQLMKNNFFLE